MVEINNKKKPTFQPIFGKKWYSLPVVMKKHYANRPFSNDEYTAKGTLDVMCKPYLIPIIKLFGTIPASNEKNVPITVCFKSKPDSKAFCLMRVFHFNNNPVSFNSSMYQVKNNHVMEVMNLGITWHLYYDFDGEKVTLSHKGYSIRVFGFNMPLPITWLIGRGDAEEKAIDENSFEMSTQITHPLLGVIYGYRGRFEIKND